MRSPCQYCTIRKLRCHDQCNKYQFYRSGIKQYDSSRAEFYEYSESAIKRMGSEGRRI